MFMMAYGFDYMTPTLQSLLLYLQCLVNSFKNITSIKNYISGARTFVSLSGGNTALFTSPILATVIRGAARLSTHVPRPAPPLGRLQLHRLCAALRRIGGDGRVAMAAVLFGVATFLRQSNFLPQSTAGGGSPPDSPPRCLPGGRGPPG